MIDALIHFLLNTAFVVVFAPIATIVFLIAFAFLVHPTPARPCATPEIALDVLNQSYARGEISRSEYLQNRDDILAAQVRR